MSALHASALEKLGSGPLLRDTIEKFREVHPSFAPRPHSLEQQVPSTPSRSFSAAERTGRGRVCAWVLSVDGLELMSRQSLVQSSSRACSAPSFSASVCSHSCLAKCVGCASSGFVHEPVLAEMLRLAVPEVQR
jgi:hypothetical protein